LEKIFRAMLRDHIPGQALEWAKKVFDQRNVIAVSAASSVNLLKILETCVTLTASWGGSLDRWANFYSPHHVNSIRSLAERLAPPNIAP
jgi:uncharacterized protein (DUF1778 family)